MIDSNLKNLLIGLQSGLSGLAFAAKGALSDNIVSSIDNVVNNLRMNLDSLDSQYKYDCSEHNGPVARRLRENADVQMRAEALLRNDGIVQNYLGYANKMINVLAPHHYTNDTLQFADVMQRFYSFEQRVDHRHHYYVSWHTKLWHETKFKVRDEEALVRDSQFFSKKPEFTGTSLSITDNHQFILSERQRGGSEVKSKFGSFCGYHSCDVEVVKDALENTSYRGNGKHLNYPWLIENFSDAMKQFGFEQDTSTGTQQEFIDTLSKSFADVSTPEYLTADFMRSAYNSHYQCGNHWYTEHLDSEGQLLWKFSYGGPHQGSLRIQIEGTNASIGKVTFDQKEVMIADTPFDLQNAFRDEPTVYLTPSTWASLISVLVSDRMGLHREMADRKRRIDEGDDD